jgi:hypothetical protein
MTRKLQLFTALGLTLAALAACSDNSGGTDPATTQATPAPADPAAPPPATTAPADPAAPAQ